VPVVLDVGKDGVELLPGLRLVECGAIGVELRHASLAKESRLAPRDRFPRVDAPAGAG
jgi:hypothetical protein